MKSKFPCYEECHRADDLNFKQPNHEITGSVYYRKDLSKPIDKFTALPVSASFYAGGMVEYKDGHHILQYNESKGYFIVLLV